jgi:hypothetical protein
VSYMALWRHMASMLRQRNSSSISDSNVCVWEDAGYTLECVLIGLPPVATALLSLAD